MRLCELTQINTILNVQFRAFFAPLSLWCFGSGIIIEIYSMYEKNKFKFFIMQIIVMWSFEITNLAQHLNRFYFYVT